MAQVLVTDTYLTNIANAIRGKNGLTTTYTPPNMDDAIAALPGFTKVGEITCTTSTTSTSAGAVSGATFTNSSLWTDKIVYVRVRDTAGKRAGYFYGSDSFFINYNKANGSTTAISTAARILFRYTTSSQWGATSGGYGVYAYDINSSGRVRLYQRYNSNYSLTINGTYKAEIYLLDWPVGVSAFG